MIDVKSKPCENPEPGFRYLAWGKCGALVADNAVLEPGDVWFDYGDTSAEAEAKVRSEIKASLL